MLGNLRIHVTRIFSHNIKLYAPLRDLLREYVAQPLDEFSSAQTILVLEIQTAPRRHRSEELALLLTCTLPCDASSKRARIRLLDRKPAVGQGLLLVSNVPQPAILLSCRDSVRLRENTCMKV